MAAGLLVLVGLGLFVAGVLTGDTAFYWACVGASVVAAVLLDGATEWQVARRLRLPARRVFGLRREGLDELRRLLAAAAAERASGSRPAPPNPDDFGKNGGT